MTDVPGGKRLFLFYGSCWEYDGKCKEVLVETHIFRMCVYVCALFPVCLTSVASSFIFNAIGRECLPNLHVVVDGLQTDGRPRKLFSWLKSTRESKTTTRDRLHELSNQSYYIHYNIIKIKTRSASKGWISTVDISWIYRAVELVSMSVGPLHH
jgi:hypothetical protein